VGDPVIALLTVLRLLFGGDARYPAEVDPYLAAAQAQVESDLDPCAVSRVVGGRRVSGHWDCDRPFPRAWRGPFFCGLWMTEAYTERACREVQDTVSAWRARRLELRAWLDATRGGLRPALAGYGCGYWGASHPGLCGGSADPYADRVVRLSRSKKWKK